MRRFRNIQFGEGISCTLEEFKKIFVNNLKDLSSSEVKEAHKIATKGNGKLQDTPRKSKETKSKKDK